jgi:hypothetical protein
VAGGWCGWSVDLTRPMMELVAGPPPPPAPRAVTDEGAGTEELDDEEELERLSEDMADKRPSIHEETGGGATEGATEGAELRRESTTLRNAEVSMRGRPGEVGGVSEVEVACATSVDVDVALEALEVVRAKSADVDVVLEGAEKTAVVPAPPP